MTRKFRAAEAALGPALLAGLIAVSLLSASCGAGGGGTGLASATPCAITVQARALDNSGLLMGVGNVEVLGSLYSVVGASSCSGTITSFTGYTNMPAGTYLQPSTQMNANWTVTWSWLDTPFYACPPHSETEYVPDAGAVFDDDCSL